MRSVSQILSAALVASTTVTATVARPCHDCPVVDDVVWTSDVTAGSAFTATLNANDPLGVDTVTFKAYPNKGWWYPCPESTQFSLVNGTIYDGTWQVECPLPSDTPSQTYAFNYNCVDTEGYNTYVTFTDGFTVSGGPDADYDAPAVEKISCAETVSAGAMLDVYLTIADESGVDTDISYIKAHQTDGNVVACYSTQFVLDSGTLTDGVFKASCLVPADTPNGEYWLEVHVYDTQKNPAQPRVDDAFEVVDGATPELTPPSITNVQYADDTVERGETLYVSATVSDLESGVSDVSFQARESYSQGLLCEGPMQLESGDMDNGQWTFSCIVPSDSMIASYTGQVRAYDKQSNTAFVSAYFSVVWPEKV
mmetsp:Transcript_15689/g.26153  ORF Transcript_15689/g.26153 Transcript_15689/m.26153 type:complete len:367 (+) Transcript_15689:114-1214(+)